MIHCASIGLATVALIWMFACGGKSGSLFERSSLPGSGSDGGLGVRSVDGRRYTTVAAVSSISILATRVRMICRRSFHDRASRPLRTRVAKSWRHYHSSSRRV